MVTLLAVLCGRFWPVAEIRETRAAPLPRLAVFDLLSVAHGDINMRPLLGPPLDIRPHHNETTFEFGQRHNPLTSIASRSDCKQEVLGFVLVLYRTFRKPASRLGRLFPIFASETRRPLLIFLAPPNDHLGTRERKQTFAVGNTERTSTLGVQSVFDWPVQTLALGRDHPMTVLHPFYPRLHTVEVGSGALGRGRLVV